MPFTANRKRAIRFKFFVDENELAVIKQRMGEFGTDNLSAIFAPWRWRDFSGRQRR